LDTQLDWGGGLLGGAAGDQALEAGSLNEDPAVPITSKPIPEWPVGMHHTMLETREQLFGTPGSTRDGNEWATLLCPPCTDKRSGFAMASNIASREQGSAAGRWLVDLD